MKAPLASACDANTITIAARSLLYGLTLVEVLVAHRKANLALRLAFQEFMLIVAWGNIFDVEFNDTVIDTLWETQIRPLRIRSQGGCKLPATFESAAARMAKYCALALPSYKSAQSVTAVPPHPPLDDCALGMAPRPLPHLGPLMAVLARNILNMAAECHHSLLSEKLEKCQFFYFHSVADLLLIKS